MYVFAIGSLLVRLHEVEELPPRRHVPHGQLHMLLLEGAQPRAHSHHTARARASRSQDHARAHLSHRHSHRHEQLVVLVRLVSLALADLRATARALARDQGAQPTATAAATT